MNDVAMRRIRSFVLRNGRMTPGQRQAFNEHWQRFGLDFGERPVNPSALFGRAAPLVLEIGFGMGQSLISMAKAEPDKNFIGVEVHLPGVGRLLRDLSDEGISNVRVFNHDAVEVLQQLIPDACLDRVQIYFPDPWHKKKHHKRRLIQPQFIELLRQKMSTGGVLHLATDWENYAEHMMEVMCLAQGFSNMAEEYCFSERPDYRPITKFERRGEKLGHGVWDLLFKKIV